MRKLNTLGVIAILGSGACGLGVGSGDGQVVQGDDVDPPDDDGGGDDPAGGSCATSEPDLPYDVKIQCGDSVIPVVAAFREKNGPDVRFAPAPGATTDCPFLVEGAVIRADEIASCAAFVATADDAAAEGNRDAGRDRVEVTWCWYSNLSTDHDGNCCLAPGAEQSIQCETDHLDIRFSCDGGEGAPDGADQPLDPGAVPATCDCDTDGDGTADSEDPDDDNDGNPDDADDCDDDPDPCGPGSNGTDGECEVDVDTGLCTGAGGGGTGPVD